MIYKLTDEAYNQEPTKLQTDHKQVPTRFHRVGGIDLCIKQFDIQRKDIAAFIFSYIWYMFPVENKWGHGLYGVCYHASHFLTEQSYAHAISSTRVRRTFIWVLKKYYRDTWDIFVSCQSFICFFFLSFFFLFLHSICNIALSSFKVNFLCIWKSQSM